MEKAFHKFMSASSHAEVVGSFILPERLKEARARHASGIIDSQQLSAVENECVTELVARQKKAGLSVVTDGEYRRMHWANDFFCGLAGIDKVNIRGGHLYQSQEVLTDIVLLSGKVKYNPAHPFFSHFRFLKEVAHGAAVKQTLPSPSQLFVTLKSHNGNVIHYYGSDSELAADIVDAYVATVKTLYDIGCRHVQFDDNSLGRFCDPDYIDRKIISGIDVESEIAGLIDINNRVIDSLPGDMFVAAHICRGNHHSPWVPAGDYNLIAPFLFAGVHVDRLLLEFDITLDNDFSPLRYLPEGVEVVLGLVASHHPQMENLEKLVESVYAAANYVDIDRIGVGPRCGFHSDEMTALAENYQWDKIGLIMDTAKRLWQAPVLC
ncbi:5-methyltetrahydropteroyltriglutamate--homocysteine methyltransferase [Barnesiella sp. WM24]|uniref:5-methyltetrahydropteroyltriglutamate-- homocysteine methyltransferase n=1 Tax=Barnesiella sp. WM24 TaxID=2558278 RepID=UPI0010725EC2|nr:5-methyltetrahydropteroyltriglutamate--homocysteine methyltransferase [Barnesiella sp. WM24]TFU93992.1 5-methyltetrahydropteroyltriglutamate--homocysteine methyltransferase [Barnesiella sp. WM24]